MIKRTISILVLLTVITLILIPSASASGVSVTFSGEKNVKPGQSYTISYNVNMTGGQALLVSFKCNCGHIVGDTTISFDRISPTIENVDFSKSGQFTVSIDESAKIGDKITISTNGKYTVVDELGVPNKVYDISETYTLTVVSDEVPTPSPTDIQTPEPTVITSEAPVPASPTEPIATTTPKPSPKVTHKPQTTSTENTPASSSTYIEQSVVTQTSSKPQEKGSDTWGLLLTKLDLMHLGDRLEISLESSPDFTIVPEKILKAIKAKGGIIDINLGDYLCQINADNMSDSLGESTNLLMDLSLIDDPIDGADSNDAYQLHFTQDGDFPGCFVYSFKAFNNQPGDDLNIYRYHVASGKSEFIQNAIVDTNGCVSFDVYEGGTYIVSNSQIADNPRTGEQSDTNNIATDIFIFLVPIICILITIACVIIVLRRIKSA